MTPIEMTRRQFLKLSGVAVAGLALPACGAPKSPSTPEEPQPPEPKTTWGETLLEPIEPKAGEIPLRLEAREAAIQNSPLWFPDTRTSWLSTTEGIIVFGSAGVDSVRVTGPSWEALDPAEVILRPEGRQTELGFTGYRGLTAVFPGANPGKLLGIYHEELWPNKDTHFPFKARIGIAVSPDQGRTWQDQRTIISGNVTSEFGVVGAGQPAAIVTQNEKGEKEVAVYYTNWDLGNATICVAKALLAEATNPQAWKKWDGQHFNNPGLGGEASPVIEAPAGPAALPCISWNTTIQKFLMIMERGYEADETSGFYALTSDDGINWGPQQLIARFPQSHSRRDELTNQGQPVTWYSYQTLISPDTGDQFITNDKGYLLVSRGVWNTEPHKGVLIPFTIG